MHQVNCYVSWENTDAVSPILGPADYDAWVLYVWDHQIVFRNQIDPVRIASWRKPFTDSAVGHLKLARRAVHHALPAGGLP